MDAGGEFFRDKVMPDFFGDKFGARGMMGHDSHDIYAVKIAALPKEGF